MKYTVENMAGAVKLQIFSNIGGNDGFTLKEYNAAVDTDNASSVTIDMNSPGGDPFEAFAIYDAIKNTSARVTVNITGMSASAATIIAAAADYVTITENSRYLVHEASIMPQGGSKKTELIEQAEMLAKIDEQMLKVYMKRTGKSVDELTALMVKDTFISAEEAKEWGFVDEIIKEKTKLKIAAMAELTDNDKMLEEMELLKAENLKLKEELQAMKEAKAMEEEEKIDEVVESYVKEGRITAEVKSFWVGAFKADAAQAKAAVDAIKMPEPAPMVFKVEEVGGKHTQAAAKTTAEAWDYFKSGVYKTQYEYAQALKTINDGN